MIENENYELAEELNTSNTNRKACIEDLQADLVQVEAKLDALETGEEGNDE